MFTGTPEEIAAKRAAILAEALTWEGTKFHDACGVKGEGVDCIHFAKCVYVVVGLVPDFEIGPYKPQWFMHRDEPLMLMGIAKHARQVDRPLPGDLEMYNFGRHAAHCGIVVDEYTIIHAYKPVGFVTRGDRREFEGRRHSAWSLFP